MKLNSATNENQEIKNHNHENQEVHKNNHESKKFDPDSFLDNEEELSDNHATANEDVDCKITETIEYELDDIKYIGNGKENKNNNQMVILVYLCSSRNFSL